MEIITYGNLEKQTVKRFQCTYCGCIFEADKNEYNCISIPLNGNVYSCNCPCCLKEGAVLECSDH